MAKYLLILAALLFPALLAAQNLTNVVGDGSPEGVVIALPGSTYTRRDGPPYRYVKDSGTGNTGWVAHPPYAVSHAASHQQGGSDEIATVTAGANAIPKANGSGKLALGWLLTGSGNGLDADTVDGSHASAFAANSHTHTLADITNEGALAAKNTVATADLDNDAVTFAKLQNITDARLLGRSAGSTGDAQEITVGSGLTLSGGALTANGGGAGDTIAYKSSDQTAIGTAYADVTSVGLSVLANKAYAFEFVLISDADATTTGIDVAVNGPASPTAIVYEQIYWTTATARTERPATAYDANTASAGSPGTARAIFRVRGILVNGANAGTLTARAKREAVGTGPNIRAGSYGRLTPLN